MHNISNSRSSWPRSGTVRDIRKLGDPVLRTACETVHAFNARLDVLIADMFATMYDVNGIGLAANQIGVNLRVIVFDCPDNLGSWHQGYMINPKRISVSEEVADDSEGCLSIPTLYSDFPRSTSVVCEGQDLEGSPIHVEGSAYFARCLLHETQHLEGTLYIDLLKGEARHKIMRAIADSPSVG